MDGPPRLPLRLCCGLTAYHPFQRWSSFPGWRHVPSGFPPISLVGKNGKVLSPLASSSFRFSVCSVPASQFRILPMFFSQALCRLKEGMLLLRTENLHSSKRKPLQCSATFLMFRPHFGSGRSVAWLARLFRVQEVVSSNLTAPTICSSPKGIVWKTRTWRNWQTRYFEVVVPYGVQVQVLPCAPNAGSGKSSGNPRKWKFKP